MKTVWVAIRDIKWEGTEFLGVAVNKEKAKSICGSDRNWQDSEDGKESVADETQFTVLVVYETDLIQ